MPKRLLALLLCLVTGGLWFCPRPAAAEVETRQLVAVDATGSLTEAKLAALAEEAQATLDRVLALWGGDADIAGSGKIRVVFDAPRRGNYSCVFYVEKAARGRVRVVRVFGFEGGTQMLAHKLASAAYPQRDKLLRNMLGIVTEARAGNPLTFPRCGLGSDDWTLALLKAGTLIPLKELGPEHESWGMSDSGGGRLMVFDRPRQHRAYAQAGSFGEYLCRVYGLEKLRRLQQLSGERDQLLQAVYGADLETLEAQWLAALRQDEAAAGQKVALAARLLRADPQRACAAAQKFAEAGK